MEAGKCTRRLFKESRDQITWLGMEVARFEIIGHCRGAADWSRSEIVTNALVILINNGLIRNGLLTLPCLNKVD